MKKKVLVTDKISEKTKLFSQKYITPEADLYFSDHPGDCEGQIASAHVLITATKGISKEMIDQAENCIYIQKYGAGVNNIAVGEATNRGIPVGCVAGVNATSVAEYAVLFMLAVSRHLTIAHNKLVYEGLWLKAVLRDDCYQLSGKKIGLIGLGNIGRQVVKLLQGFNCQVRYFDIFRQPPEEEARLGVAYTDLDTLIRESDVISLHAPLTDQTYHIINEKRLMAMKPRSILVNTSRGGLVDEKALINVLNSGHLLGAGIDVYENEPIDNNHPLTKIDRVILSPHNGGGTNEAVEAVVKESYKNINSMLLQGKVSVRNYVVNADRLPDSLFLHS